MVPLLPSSTANAPGCDSCALWVRSSAITAHLSQMLSCTILSSIGISGVPAVVLVLMSTSAFFFPHWESLNIGTFFLPWGFDVGQLAVCAVYVVTAVKGAPPEPPPPLTPQGMTFGRPRSLRISFGRSAL